MRFAVLAVLTVGALPLLLSALSACADDPAPPPQAEQPQQQQAAPATAAPLPVVVQQEQEEAQAAAPREGLAPVRLLIGESAALERNGYWEQALAVRDEALAAAGESLDIGEVAALQLDRVRLLLRLGRAEEAAAALGAIAVVSPEQSRRQALLTAQAALALGDVDGAVAAVERYEAADSPAWAAAAVALARALQAAGRGAEALAWAERALTAAAGELPLQDRLRALYLAATEHDRAGDVEQALQRYAELLAESPRRDDQVLALSRTAALRHERGAAGDSERAHEAWRRLVEEYPAFAESHAALELLQADGVEVPLLVRAVNLIHQQRWAEARFELLNLLGTTDVLAEQVAGEFYIADIHQAQGDADSAALGYAAVIGRDPTDPLAAEAAMRLAELAELNGDAAAAAEQWQFVFQEQPQHARAAEAARRWAQAAYRAAALTGDWGTAAQRFGTAAAAAADGEWDVAVQQEFLLWAALLLAEAGSEALAEERARAALALSPSSYFGLRAAVLLGVDSPSALDLTAVEWLQRLTGQSPPSSERAESLTASLAADPRWRAAYDLRLGGFDDAADRAFASWVDGLGEAWTLHAAAEFLSQQGEAGAAAQAAQRLLAHFGLDWQEAPAALLRLAYPQPYPDVMALHAGAEGIDPLLLWALVRRESFYDADARGAAGEVGLTQVIPLTGSDIAAALGIAYEHDDLARPALSLQFGAWYLARQLEGFGGEPILALAAYNAGPGNAARWEAEAVLSGPDAFLAALDFASTRAYAQYVVEAYAAYRAAYPAADVAADLGE